MRARGGGYGWLDGGFVDIGARADLLYGEVGNDFFGGPDSGSIEPYRDGSRDAQLLLGFDAIQKF